MTQRSRRVCSRGTLIAVGLGLATALFGNPARASTVEHCNLPVASLGRLIANDTRAEWFARLAGGTVTPGAAIRVRVRISGCAPNAVYRIWAADPISVSNGKRTIALTPIVTAVDGIQRTPASIVGPGNRLELSGNPELELVFAIDPAALPLSPGNWSGSAQISFEDR